MENEINPLNAYQNQMLADVYKSYADTATVRTGSAPTVDAANVQSYKQYLKDITSNDPGKYGTDEGLFGLGTTNQWGTAMGLGGLAMKAIALPGQMEYYGAQTDLAKQQLASNKQAMADKQKFNDTWAYASNSLPSQNSGLAGHSFTGAAGYGTGTIGSTNPVLK